MSTIIRENITKNISYYRKLHGYTQKELANILGIKNSSVSNWEQGQNAPDIETIFKLCQLFQISVSDMFGCDVIEGESIRVTEFEKEILLAYRKSDSIGKELVHRALHLDETTRLKRANEKMA